MADEHTHCYRALGSVLTKATCDCNSTATQLQSDGLLTEINCFGVSKRWSRSKCHSLQRIIYLVILEVKIRRIRYIMSAAINVAAIFSFEEDDILISTSV
jgi:hypothetical protein